MIDGRFRATFEKSIRPVGSKIRKTGITADHLTAFGGLMAVGVCISFGFGNLPLAFLFGIMSAVPDVLDGAVAKASGTASPRGAFFDSVMDRVADALMLIGVTWYFANEHPGSALVLLPVAVLASSMLISYERARAESLGFDARGGLMERAERLILLGLGALFPVLLIPILALMLVLTLVTAGQRFAKVWKQASVERPLSDASRRRQARRRQARQSRALRRGGGSSSGLAGLSGTAAAWRSRRPRGPRD